MAKNICGVRWPFSVHEEDWSFAPLVSRHEQNAWLIIAQEGDRYCYNWLMHYKSKNFSFNWTTKKLWVWCHSIVLLLKFITPAFSVTWIGDIFVHPFDMLCNLAHIKMITQRTLLRSNSTFSHRRWIYLTSN